MSRKPIIAGNWKMNLLQADAKALFEGIQGFVKDFTAQQLPTVVVAPVFTSLSVIISPHITTGTAGGHPTEDSDKILPMLEKGDKVNYIATLKSVRLKLLCRNFIPVRHNL